MACFKGGLFMVKEMMLEESARVLGAYCSPIMFPVTEVQRTGFLPPQAALAKAGASNLGLVSPIKSPFHMPILPICPNRYQ
jgi:hypothetical protein